jgi:hypothetical protein
LKTPHPFHIHVPREPVDLWDKLKRLAAREQHLLKVEALNAIVAHLKTNGLLTESEIKKLRE